MSRWPDFKTALLAFALAFAIWGLSVAILLGSMAKIVEVVHPWQ